MSDLREFDQAHQDMFDAVQKFFRFHKTHIVDSTIFDDAYYERTAEMLRKRIDHEIKYLHSPILT